MKWISAFAAAHAKFFPYNDVTDRTSRIVIPCNLPGKKIRVQLSNRFGEEAAVIGSLTAAVCDENGILDPSSLTQLTVGGKESIVLVPGKDLYTDEVSFQIHSGDHVAVSLYFPDQHRITSGANIGHYAIRSIPGDFSRDASFVSDKLMVCDEWEGKKYEYEPESPLPIFKSLEVLTDESRSALAVFGDSLTAMDFWTKPFAEKLYQTYPGTVSCCNLGISGCCLFRDCPEMMDGGLGESGIARFDRDVLELAGVKTVLFLLGTNDLCYPSICPGAPAATAEEYRTAFRELSEKASKKGLRTVCITILPRTDVMSNEDTEQLRKTVNEIILTEGIFDTVIDAEEAVMDESGSIRPEYFQIDNLHLSAEGGAALAEFLDLGLVLGQMDRGKEG